MVIKRYIRVWHKRIRHSAQVLRLLPALQISLGVILGSLLAVCNLLAMCLVILILGRRTYALLSISCIVFAFYTYHIKQQPVDIITTTVVAGEVEQVQWLDPFTQKAVILLSGGARARVALPANTVVTTGQRLEFKHNLKPVSEVYQDKPGMMRSEHSLGVQWVAETPVDVQSQTSGSNFLLRNAGQLQYEIRQLVTRQVKYPYSGLVLGIVTGDDSDLEPSEEAFRRSGLSHLTAVSGFNVMLLVSACCACAGLLPRRGVWVITVALAWFYLLLVGVHVIPAFRAVIMASLSIAARLGGRPLPIWLGFTYTIALMLIIHPLLWWNVSFQLSAAALGGVLLMGPMLTNGMLARVPELLRNEVAATLGATLTTGPISALQFGTVSTVGLAANLIGLPALTLLNAFSYGALLSMAVPPLSDKLWQMSEIMARIISLIATKFSELNFASISMHPLVPLGLMLGVFLLSDYLAVKRRFICAN